MPLSRVCGPKLLNCTSETRAPETRKVLWLNGLGMKGNFGQKLSVHTRTRTRTHKIKEKPKDK